MMTVSQIALAALLWPGHAVIWTVPLNWAYAQPWPKPLLRTIRAICGLIIVGLPLAFVALAQSGPWEWMQTPWQACYLFACALLAWMVLPIITVRRWLRKPVAPLIAERSIIRNIAAELPEFPVPPSKARWLTKLPGNDALRVEFSELTLAPPRLPAAWDGLTILHLSDLHLIGTPTQAYFQKVMEHVQTLGTPDLLVITGDLVDTPTHHRWLIRLLHPLRWNYGAFAILGNHDWLFDDRPIRRRLQRLGMHVIGNGMHEMTVRGEPLQILGNEGPWFVPVPDPAKLPHGPFRLLLSHTPDNLPWAKSHHVDLMLSGHNHGGQIRIPGFGPIFVPSRFGRRYDMGTFFEPPTLMHVNRGLSGKTPLRLFCPPQVSWITLRTPAAEGTAS
ncbi:metallophosphoesterase [Tuwongella immobilis]|uniref:Calcineurin-like phosphoesterase domain-containing protein n=1 Tax=Tuwongella immobilis TaxID=692036 RepID=A0A6C2YMR8_9BACT|nr:metallophosphoesterase [Tuwongella immobilis]VIP02888.1 metallophosphoesterase : Metallophosphoesterase OS=Planctomyces brasiliensis (strain ATCC 49424 / DSM 5305 / JCM 21570 / NBRC 103401 / IFAM 1448) GN=Plabr_2249 PE=4 SV=1: Metallophos_2 [Tuwongella immobilis]VTS02752.1 metallophosphoesterase : Metallophosphoesterase OS=Planctomyces brasiliensis (strain ATCC 49424 / DSM 5305 / JCM 21570 / NBRC 103401 / IFAM 1448) GN=Plabr_2249 PE=4 SV=1: Metallophos_2 [Tuwongella immobilis]